MAEDINAAGQGQAAQETQEYDYHPMWESLGMNVADHDMLLGAVGQMYGDMFLAQKNRPASTSYLDTVVSNIHSGRIKEMLDEKAEGKATKIVGSFCLYVPEEIIMAADGISVGLCSGADWATDKVEEILPRNTCPLIKSFTGFKLGHVCPYIESSDLVVGENTCDGKKKAYEEFSRLKDMYVVDVPNQRNDATLELWRGEVRKLADKIAEYCGKPITAESLGQAIRIANEKRRALARLDATRAADPAPISGLDCLLTVQTAFMDDPVRLTGAINDMAAECEARVAAGEGAAPKGAKRVLYTGTPMAVPNWKLFNIIEKSGGVVVGEECCTGSRYYKDLVDESGTTVDEMLDNIADRYYKINCAIFTPNDGRMTDVIQMARDLHADGIIDCSLQFCTLYDTESFSVKRAAEEANIPYMHLTTDYANEDAGQLQTRIQAFLEMI
jgi:benzoyl-CoA reductase/2-hydroxyglutaryl-CoA dehydratase subunit BcrC/BadD/HgdB